MESLIKVIKYVFGYCYQCDKWFKYPTRKHIGTMYFIEEDNYMICCNKCHKQISIFVAEQWDEYHHERGC